MAKKIILFLITLVLQTIIGNGTVRAQLATAAKTPISSFIQQTIRELPGDIPGHAVSAAGVVPVWADPAELDAGLRQDYATLRIPLW